MDNYSIKILNSRRSAGNSPAVMTVNLYENGVFEGKYYLKIKEPARTRKKYRVEIYIKNAADSWEMLKYRDIGDSAHQQYFDRTPDKTHSNLNHRDNLKRTQYMTRWQKKINVKWSASFVGKLLLWF